MATRNYSNTTTAGSLTAPAAPSDVAIAVTAFSNLPAVPFTATINRGQPTEESILVTAVLGVNLTVVRGYNSTAAQTHLAGATIEHTALALDFTEANAHVNASSDVHGVTGELVGEEAAQTLLDKTLISPVVEADAAAGDAIVAYVPVGAEVRNLFRGMDPDGDDVIVVSSTGALTATALHSTGTADIDGNANVDGALTVTGKVTSGSSEATGNAKAATSTVTGNATVGGSQVVTGLTQADRLIVANQGTTPASPPLNKHTFWVTADHRAYISWPNGDASAVAGSNRFNVSFLVTSWAVATGQNEGDFGQHVTTGERRFLSNGAWRQFEPFRVTTKTARDAIASADKYVGYQVIVNATSFLYEWDGTGWRFLRYIGAPATAPAQTFGHTAFTTLASGDSVLKNYTTVPATNADLVTLNNSTGVFTCGTRGKYAITAYTESNTTTTERLYTTKLYAPAASMGTGAAVVNGGTSGFLMRPGVSWTGYADAGWVFELVVDTNFAQTVLASLTVELIG